MADNHIPWDDTMSPSAVVREPAREEAKAPRHVPNICEGYDPAELAYERRNDVRTLPRQD